VGWDWFSLQLDDGRELMLYQLRRIDGTPDPHSSGTLTEKDGSATHLKQPEFALEPLDTWRSKATGGKYPIDWSVRVPGQDIDLKVTAEYPWQELALKPVAYWEGAVKVTGTHPGVGYLEMTGYASPLKALQR
jgi:predicted secreted hydrolase